VIEHAARAVRELRAGLDRVQELRGVVAGQVRLGTSAAISVYLLPPALRAFRAKFPAVELVVMTGLASDIARLVVANDLDLGLVTLPLRDRALAITPFYRDELVAIAPRDRAWPRRRPMTAAELAREPMILFDHGSTVRRVIDQWFHRAGVAPRAAMELGNTEAIKKLVEAGLGLSVTSWFSVEAEVRQRVLTAIRLTPPLERQIGLVRRRDKPKTPALDAFVAGLDDLRRTLETRRIRRA
jgi:DNA-binding transcriptional LysR family regulator